MTIDASILNRQAFPYAGGQYDEDAYNCDTEKIDKRKLKFKCPGCKRIGAPLCSPKTHCVDTGWEWVGCDYKEPYSLHQTTCRCGHRYSFKVVTPQ